MHGQIQRGKFIFMMILEIVSYNIRIFFQLKKVLRRERFLNLLSPASKLNLSNRHYFSFTLPSSVFQSSELRQFSMFNLLMRTRETFSQLNFVCLSCANKRNKATRERVKIDASRCVKMTNNIPLYCHDVFLRFEFDCVVTHLYGCMHWTVLYCIGVPLIQIYVCN
jgi:hypothetical protein